MPYRLEQSGGGYTVVNSETGRKHSRRPLPRKRAVAQMRALYAAENKDAGTTAGPMLNGPGGLMGVPGMARRKGPIRQKDVQGFIDRKVKELMAAQPDMGEDDAREAVMRLVYAPMMTSTIQTDDYPDQSQFAGYTMEDWDDAKPDSFFHDTRPRKWGNRAKSPDCTCGVATKEQIAPGVTRIRGNLCNVHGRYGPCDPSKPTASKKPTGRARKPRKVAAPKKTPEQRAQEREAQQSGNRAKVFSQLGLQEDAIGALQDLRSGIPVADDGGLVKMGLAERAADGSYRLTASGRAVVAAANSGDPGRARDILSGAGDRKIARDERTAARETRRAAMEQRRQEVQARRAAREAERAKRQAQTKRPRAGGNKQSARDRQQRETERQADRKRRLTEHEQDRARRLREREDDRARRQRERDDDRDRRAAERERKIHRISVPGAASTEPLPEPKKPAKRESNSRPSVSRPSKKRGRFDRSNNATRSKSFTVYKSATGDLRWIARSTTSYKDRDDEIITTDALDRDSQRMTATKQFGPLRFWHLGRPDPLDTQAPWGQGVDIGDCDYSSQIGTSRVESGTFRDPIIAQRVAATADDYELSPGFFHPIDQPNARREYEDIRTFERSLVPTKYGRASNLFTGITVKEFRMDIAEQERRFKAAIEQLQLTPEQATALASGLVQADKSAQAHGVAYKSAPEEVTIGGLTYTLKAPEPEPEDDDDDEVDDGEGGDEEAIAYLGDMAPGEFWAEMKSALAPAMRMGEMLKAMEGHMAEMKALYSGATTKSTTDTAEIAALKSQIAEASARLARLEGDQPAVVNSADVEAALKGAPQAPPDPNAPVIPDDPNRPYAAIGARTFPSLYSTNPDGTFAGWNTPPAQIN